MPSRVQFDERQLMSIVSGSLGGKTVEKSGQLPYSSSNRTLYISFDDGLDVIVKASVKESRFNRIIVESELIKRLKTETDLPLPEVLHVDSSRTSFPYPFVVYSFVGGTNLVDAITDIEDKKKVGVELADVAYQIHQIEFDSPQFSIAKGEMSESWEALLRGVCTAGITALTEQGCENIDAIQEYVDTNLKLVGEPSSYKLIHRDLQPQNLNWDVQEGRISGVFDFEAAMAGDPLFDFTYLEMRLFKAYPEIRKAFYETYSRHSPLRHDYEKAIEFYGVVRDLIFYPRNINYGELDRAEVALKSIEQVVFGN